VNGLEILRAMSRRALDIRRRPQCTRSHFSRAWRQRCSPRPRRRCQRCGFRALRIQDVSGSIYLLFRAGSSRNRRRRSRDLKVGK
jgi:hypothetical protein